MAARRAYAGRTAEERDEQRRRQLLDAGLDVFGTTGFRTATVRGLCREARVADRSFYELYSTTEELLLDVYRDCVSRMMTAVTEAIAESENSDDDIEPLAHRGLDAFFEVLSDRRVARVVWLEVLGVSDAVDAEYVTTMDEFGVLLLTQMQARNPRAAASPKASMFATAAVGGIRHTGTKWLLEGFVTERADLVDACARFLVAVAAAAGEGS